MIRIFLLFTLVDKFVLYRDYGANFFLFGIKYSMTSTKFVVTRSR